MINLWITHRFWHVGSRLTVVLVSTAADCGNPESRRGSENLSLSLRCSSREQLQLLCHALNHVVAFTCLQPKDKSDTNRAHATAAFVELRVLFAVAILALVPIPPPTRYPLHRWLFVILVAFSSFPPTHIGSSLSHELAAFRQAPRACDDSLHSDCTRCRASVSIPSVRALWPFV